MRTSISHWLLVASFSAVCGFTASFAAMCGFTASSASASPDDGATECTSCKRKAATSCEHCGSCDNGGECEHSCPKCDAAKSARFDAMKARLKLSDAQTTKIQAIMKDKHAKLDALRAQPAAPDRGEAAKKIKWAADDAISTELACDQREALRKMKREERSDHRHERPHTHDQHHGKAGDGPLRSKPQPTK